MGSKYDKYIRDPLYGFIGLTTDEITLLDSQPLQRLRGIKQLAFAHLVYPSANHTRFEHSLGVLHIATRMAEQLELSMEDTQILRYAALLHDTGHGPFSHVFESFLQTHNDGNVTHENITQKIIREDQTIVSVLKKDLEMVLRIFNNANNSILKQILSSNLDADKIDYLRRDAFHIGVAYGLFDLERILHTLSTAESGGNTYLCNLSKGADALENMRLSRFLMHAQVYQHHTNIIASRMLLRALDLHIRETGGKDIPIDPTSPDFMVRYLKFDDAELMKILLASPSKKASDFTSLIKNRNLLKRGVDVVFPHVEDPVVRGLLFKTHSKEKIQALESEIAGRCGIDPDYIIVNSSKIENELFKSSYAQMMKDKTPYLIKEKNGKIRDIEMYSSLAGKEEPKFVFSIFCPDKDRKTVENISLDFIAEHLQ